jgi:hypothetical protein
MPMVQPSTPTPAVRLAQGQKRPKKKEAVVTSLDTISPYERTPQEGVDALLRVPDRPEPAARPQPVGKELRATLEGKVAAMNLLAQRVHGAMDHISNSTWRSLMALRHGHSRW